MQSLKAASGLKRHIEGVDGNTVEIQNELESIRKMMQFYESYKQVMQYDSSQTEKFKARLGELRRSGEHKTVQNALELNTDVLSAGKKLADLIKKDVSLWGRWIFKYEDILNVPLASV